MPDHGLKIPYHHGVGMGTGDTSYYVKGVSHVRNPVSHGLVHGVFECFRARDHGPYLSTQKLHTEDIKLLAFRVLLPHVYHAFLVQKRSNSSRGNPVLPRSGFSYYPVLAHPTAKNPLTYSVIYLVRPSVGKILSFKVNLGAAETLRHRTGVIKRGGPPCVLLQVVINLLVKSLVSCGFLVGPLKLDQSGHQGF